MTMRLLVKNDDPSRFARAIFVYTATGQPERMPFVEIAPGAQAEFYIHQGRELKIEEVPTPSAPSDR